MPALRRSGSTTTTLSVFNAQTSQYQRWLASLNVVLMVFSLTILFLGCVLQQIFHMDKLDFVSMYFVIFPWNLILAGLVTFLASAFGFILAGHEKRGLYCAYAVVMALLVFNMIFTIYVSLQVEALIRNNEIEENDDLPTLYHQQDNQAFRDTWDKVYQSVRCCGGKDYRDHSSKSGTLFLEDGSPLFRCVPDSCCIAKKSADGSMQPTCTYDQSANCKVEKHVTTLWRSIYVHGCMDTLQQWYTGTLDGKLTFFALGGILTALLEISALAVAAAFVSKINRKRRRFKNEGNGNMMVSFSQNGAD